MNKRVELVILEEKNIEENIKILENNIGSIYVKVNLHNLSSTRVLLINNLYTTRLFIAKKNEDVIYYIYGKKQKNKGVFNEHCKNSVVKNENYIEKIIEVSSNKNDLVLTDSRSVLKKLNEMNRTGELI